MSIYTRDATLSDQSAVENGGNPPAHDECSGVKTTLVSRNITVFNRRTSIRLEPEMWRALKEISERENCSIHDVCTLISLRKREKTSLTAAIRVFLMLYYKAAATDDGHKRAGHGDFRHMLSRARISSEAGGYFSKGRYIMEGDGLDRDTGAERREQSGGMHNRYVRSAIGREAVRSAASA